MQRNRSSGTGVIFDVEGTLVACVRQTLESWRETLADHGLAFSLEQLHPYSGMDGSDMLDRLLVGSKAIHAKKQMLAAQGQCYRALIIDQTADLLDQISEPRGIAQERAIRGG